jgi:AcrR family transcriptional regulator
MQAKDRKRDILKAAMEVFAQKGFRGTTTRDLASYAEINEAIIFRHFSTKEELYRAILEEKNRQWQNSKVEELKLLAINGEDAQFLEAIGRAILERHEKDMTFMRLFLFSALEGHELSDMFINSMPERDPLATYMQSRIDKGVFRNVDAALASRAFVGMFFSFIQWQEIFGLKKKRVFDREEVVRTFVAIFLAGMKTSSEAPAMQPKRSVEVQDQVTADSLEA